MKDYPNEKALYDSHRKYLDAMREFIYSYLEKMSPGEAEELIGLALNCQPGDDIMSAIDFGDIPHIFHEYWDDFFKQRFGYNRQLNFDGYDIRSVTRLISACRNRSWGHPAVGDLDPEFTQACLFLITDVLEEIGKLDAQREVERIRDELFSHDNDERIAEMTKQLDAVETERAELKKQVETTSDRLKEVEAEWIASEQRLETASFRLKITVAGKIVAEERLSDISNRFEEAEAENAELKKCLSETENCLRTVESEEDELEECLETTLTCLEDVEEELVACKTEIEKRNEKVVDPIPAPDFPYTGSQLRDYRKKAGLTQVAVALALGLSKGSAAAIGDWEAEREKVPPKHYAKLKKLYGLEVLPRNSRARKKKTSIAERYAAETTEEERNKLAVKVAELRINEEGTQGLAWRKIREELGLKNQEFHKVIRESPGYREAVVNRIKSLKARDEGWEYSGKLDILTGIKIAESELK